MDHGRAATTAAFGVFGTSSSRIRPGQVEFVFVVLLGFFFFFFFFFSSISNRGVLLSLFGSMAKSIETSLGAKSAAAEAPKAPVEPPWHIEGPQAEKMPVLKQQVTKFACFVQKKKSSVVVCVRHPFSFVADSKSQSRKMELFAASSRRHFGWICLFYERYV